MAMASPKESLAAVKKFLAEENDRNPQPQLSQAVGKIDEAITLLANVAGL